MVAQFISLQKQTPYFRREGNKASALEASNILETSKINSVTISYFLQEGKDVYWVTLNSLDGSCRVSRRGTWSPTFGDDGNRPVYTLFFKRIFSVRT